ncbi:MAG TPA: energy transducer TonB [Candidatus Sulfotelmatobacter sp.]|nr:energy transducer TonB [Candidatus Sulfotelmatobacter sp.]
MILRLAASFAFVSCFASIISAQAVPQRLRVSENVEQAFITKKINPIYPPIARHTRIQGSVILQVQISKSGDVENMQLFSGHPLLAPAAIDAVKQWKYKPYLLNGEPVEVQTRVTVNFTLPDKSPAYGVAGDAPGGIPPDGKGGVVSSTPSDANQRAVRVRVSQGVMAGLLLTKVPPEYPPAAKDQHIQGVVLLSVIIDRQGSVSNIQLISGHPLLAPAAIDAVKQWTYKPYLLNGEPVEVQTQITVNFTLSQ